ncbi:MAG TPA: hypothetical protein VEY67_03995 [Candidatus Dormibacteraeota bacterium]|nr:hypothetical protein [Candidatus Dormibacteraeota bacterium]
MISRPAMPFVGLALVAALGVSACGSAATPAPASAAASSGTASAEASSAGSSPGTSVAFVKGSALVVINARAAASTGADLEPKVEALAQQIAGKL